MYDDYKAAIKHLNSCIEDNVLRDHVIDDLTRVIARLEQQVPSKRHWLKTFFQKVVDKIGI